MKIPFLLFVNIILTLALSALSQTEPQNADARIISSQEFRPPETTTAAGIGGKFMIGFTVDKTGAVKDPFIVAGPSWPCGSKPRKELEELTNAAKQNVESIRFAPAINGGKPISANVTLTFDLEKIALAKTRNNETTVSDGEPNIPKFIRGGVLNGRALSLARPELPSEARAKRVSGAVSIQVLIDESGRVVKAGAINGHPLLQVAARDAACSSKFAPTLLEGHPVKISGVITYVFSP